MNIYLANAATTAIDAEVLNTMMPYLYRHYCNPSSNHYLGRKTFEIDTAVRAIAKNFKQEKKHFSIKNLHTVHSETIMY